ncbi:hypothetical protein CPB84DRAFT_1852126 [Gymnopilus junonius]|uniref:Uncharacterized protein n=1 Tax=Gymnopilus junonius TaxID=109634 RepID=A0A9P5NCV1_GYMJU|nr:hypothetical protein CPB84DRAFT_1852126 [Gymnopilus junonius]
MTEIPPEAEVIDLTGLSDSSESEGDHEVDEIDGNEELSDVESDDSEIEITLNENTRSQLQKAIATVSESRLRELLSILVESEITIEAALTRELVTLKRGTQDIVPRWEMCANCEEEYDTNTFREDGECIFHRGRLFPQEEGFEDWDEYVHGPMDTLENRKEFPENFHWTCCDKNGTSEGCVKGQHKPAVARKRKRQESPHKEVL